MSRGWKNLIDVRSLTYQNQCLGALELKPDFLLITSKALPSVRVRVGVSVVGWAVDPGS